MQFGKVLGRDNPVEFYTKYMDWDIMKRHSDKISIVYTDGRASAAPELHMLRAIWDTSILSETQQRTLKH